MVQRLAIFLALASVTACGAGSILGGDDEGNAADAGATLPPQVDAAPPVTTADAGPRADAAPMPTAETGGAIEAPGCGYYVTTKNGATAPWMPPEGAPAGADPTPYQVHLGIASDAARSMAILWRTRDNTTLGTTVRYGVDSVDERVQEGFTFRFRSGSDASSPRIRMHEVHICGLQPDTVYKYQVGTEGGWSPEYTFRTAPDARVDPSAQVSIALLGDSRGGQSHFASMVGMAESQAPDVIFFTGDAVTSGVGQAEWDAFFDLAKDVLPYIPLVMANGNHENNAVNFYSQLAMRGNEEWFGLDYGPAHLTVLNDSPRLDSTIAGEQKSFLEQDAIASSGSPWRFAMHHKSMYSASGGHGSNTDLRGIWGPVIDQYHYDMVLSGHDHDYERTHSMKAGEVVADGVGTLYIVAGGAGAELYTSGTKSFTAFSASVHHYVILDVRAGRLDGRAFREDGTPLDRFSLTK